MTAPENPRSAGEMMSDILGNVSNLVRNETDLARAEVAESLAKAKLSLVAMIVGFALAITGLNALVVSLVSLVVWGGVPPQWASALVGFCCIVVAFAFLSFAKTSLNQIGFVPTRAARNLKRDVAVIKDSFND